MANDRKRVAAPRAQSTEPSRPPDEVERVDATTLGVVPVPDTRLGYSKRDEANNAGTAYGTGKGEEAAEDAGAPVGGVVAGAAVGAAAGAVVAGPVGAAVGGIGGAIAGAAASEALEDSDGGEVDAGGADNNDEDWVAKPAGQVRVHRTYSGEFYPEDSPADVKRRDQL
jgi:hypothetical protein